LAIAMLLCFTAIALHDSKAQRDGKYQSNENQSSL
jgi:hypothetical protein